MPTLTFEDIADTLRTARSQGTPIAAPTETWPDLDVSAAFEVQKINVAHAIADGDRLVGYKLGNIAKVMQAAFGLDQPDYGHLLASTFAYEGTTLEREKFIEPFVELEPAFVLRKHLRGPNITVADAIDAIEFALPAIEIIDSRVKDWAIGLPDTLADNGSTGAVLLGGTPRRVTDLNLRDTRGVLRFNDREVIAGSTGYILGNPLAAVAWLVNRVAEYGVEFEPGQVILPGSCLQAVPMNEAGRWSGTFEGWGTIEFDVSIAAKN
ncbi:2-hydroxypenta-2,4-dienoate hydratase [Rhodococcus opacus]|uniref:2-keto-4-pentenoate hydratase n=1 Tax=Rhodococcus opacus TaxID=37919 RepID=UPI001FF43D86|nr:2-hydroxypenta-2,4-dienoate hydratase [Rhodococcus opacus]UOT03222.1 2-hydroxypenta-2,4-dienoate hydratase [Rhodococcus opacus]